MYRGRKISLVLPTYNEKESIRKVIMDFEALHIIDEIIVINNNAAQGTSQEVSMTSAKEIHEPVQGYGSAIQRGLRESSGDIIAVCEPDDTFLAEDLHKFLAYSEDVEIVYGSRTVKIFIWERANMGFLLRWGNWGVAKMIEFLFNTNYLSDVGCTYRIISRPALDKLSPYFKVKSNFFGPEMIVRGYKMNIRSMQIPINYKERVGKSSVTGDMKKAFILGIKMIILIFALRFNLDKVLLKFLK